MSSDKPVKTIEELDPNFKPVSLGEVTDVVFQNVLTAPFQIHGLMRDETEHCFVRMPLSIARQTNEGVAEMVYHLAGGRVRFATDSPFVAFRASMHYVAKMSHFAWTGSVGADLYCEENGRQQYVKTFVPPAVPDEGFDSVIPLPPGEGMREITVNLPLYSGIKELQLGLKAGSRIAAPRPYRVQKPVVYYGSSITQGGCASRPGMAYPAIISRDLDCDHINMGFSGSARGEKIMVEYLAGLEMSAFVQDYDHNAPTPEHLAATHEPLFLAVREKHPDLPILLVSRPRVNLTEEEKRRREVVARTYANALARGDRHVAFVDGTALLQGVGGDEATVDSIHPTDLGFWGMAKVIGAELKNWI